MLSEKCHKNNYNDKLYDENFIEKLHELGEKLSSDPSNYSGIRSLVSLLKKSLDERILRKYNAYAYMFYLIFLDILNNTVEDNYVRYIARERLGRCISNELVRVSESKQSIEKCIINICKIFSKIIAAEKLKASPVIEQLKYENLNLLIRLSKKNVGNFSPAAWFETPYLIVIDDILTHPDLLEATVNAFYEQLINLDVQKLCFIEKDFGPTGTLLLATHIASKVNLPYIIYRQRRWSIGSTLVGCLEKISKGIDKVCIIYDLCITGGAIVEAADYIEENLRETKVTDAIVFYDFKQPESKQVSKRGIRLHSLLSQDNINNIFIRNMIIHNYRQYLQKLIKDFNEGKITYERFLRKGAEPLIKHIMLSGDLIR